MTSSRPSVRRRVLAGAIPLVLAAGALPLMAPTCGNMAPGTKTFARSSLIIPMDVCYQSMNDDLHQDSNGSGYAPAGCPQAKAPGDVIRAYGLVYQLIRNNITVYWVISPSKHSTTDIDMSIQYNGGPPALLYDWNAGAASTTGPTSGNNIDYRGGPFVVDGSDFARAVAVLTAYKTTFSGVNVHVSNVAFQGYVSKTMAGGWNAGGTVPPKLALLDIGSSGAGNKNAEPVIQGYLTRAGLDTAGAAGTTTGTHGQIYDRLVMPDFLPGTPGDWTTSNLGLNGYQILWVPHWAAPSSCSDCTGFSSSTCPCKNKYGATTVATALQTIGSFNNAGHDVFAECAGLGSFEGVFANTGSTTYGSTYGPGGTNTHFQTAPPTGFWINAWPGGSTDQTIILGGYSSPLMQIGDFPFVAASGAIEDYEPSAYQSGVFRFISDKTNPTYDIFSMIPAAGTHGTIVYLAGHSYSGTDGSFEVAGTRLVLNTLFNLGASCVATGAPCNTGLLGVCAQGVMSCDANGQPYCKQVVFPTPEVCDGKDNDCNGLVDDGLDQQCYDGPSGTRNVGVCKAGVSSCVQFSNGSYGMSACQGEVLPTTEVCNGLDDACTGHPDQVYNSTSGTWVPLSGPCYTGPSSSLDPVSGQPRGICKAGVSTCANGTWGACQVCPAAAWKDRSNPLYASCEILPLPQDCTDPVGKVTDMTCSGVINCGCTDGATQPCYDGPPGTEGIGICKGGTRTCSGTPPTWGECSGEQTPLSPDCTSSADNNCNGIPDNAESTCHVCPASGDPALSCPIPDSCPGTNADGTPCTIAWILPPQSTDPACTSSASCTSPKTCVDGFCRTPCTPSSTAGCVPAGQCQNGVRSCANGVLGECTGSIFPSPEVCDGKDNNCNGQIDENPDTLCGAVLTCVTGVCVPSSCGVENICPKGFQCSDPTSGQCVRTDCPLKSGTYCQPGEICQFGVECADPCQGVTCGVGAACSTGFCMGGGCYVSGCPTGQVCQQGSCVPDPCGGIACPLGTFCRAGDCVQSCVYVTCPSGQVCSLDGFCENDPCEGVICNTPGQICSAGACVDDPCGGKGCGARQVCQGGICEDDPCNVVKCPVGACSNGQCYPVTKVDTSTPTTTTSGGGCGSGPASPLAALLLVLFFPLFRRRGAGRAAREAARPFRPGGGKDLGGGKGQLALLALAALALAAPGCKKGTTNVDLSSCTQTCGEQQCVDLNYDAAHCGTCDTVCDSGQSCRDGVCGPSSSVAPFIDSVSPSQANHGLVDPVTVTLTGERFASGATVRAISTSGTATYSTTFLDPSHLTADLDLTDVPITELDLRVVNPDRVISNAVPFDVVSVAPVLTGVTPTSVPTGAVTPLDVSGSGFTVTSQCHLTPHGASQPDTPLPTASDGAGGLNCTLDATSLALGGYDLTVVNDGTLYSNAEEFQVVGSGTAPTLNALSPSAAQAGAVVSVTIVGTGFDVTSTAYFGGTAATTTYLGPTQLLVELTVGSASVTVTVHNGSGPASNGLQFTVVSNPPSVANLVTSPSPPYQGQTVTLTFSGSSFPAGTTTITVVPPVGAPVNTAGTVNAAGNTVTGQVSLAGEPSGLYSAYVTFSDGVVSASLPFRVLSNVAVLYSASPGGGQQGTSVPLTLTVSNLPSPLPATVGVTFTGPGLSTPMSLSGAVANSTTVTTTLPLAGQDTGVFALAVVNPGASPSNQVSFTVLPGAPTLTAVTPSCVVQSNNPVSIVLTGTNFALPDAQGNAVSQVMYSADGGVTFNPVPATITVNSSTKMTGVFDTRNALAGTTYNLAVWNPPGPMKSNANLTLKVSGTTCP